MLNMEKTPVWLDMPGDYTSEIKGSEMIIGSTGQEKTRINVCSLLLQIVATSY